MGKRPLLLIVPFYRNAHLVDRVGDNLQGRTGELLAEGGRVLWINDSPQDPAVGALMAEWARRLQPLAVECRKNEENLGFVRTANRGLGQALAEGADALLLNSDVLLAEGALREMRRVLAAAPGCGFVNPRSNNATICSLPYQGQGRDISFAEAHQAFRPLSSLLPAWHHAPTGVGFCLLIRHEVLDRCGPFDEVYGSGYNEENDLCMRARRAGWLVALANRAFAFHEGSTSFTQQVRDKMERRNRAILLSRYPEYEGLVGGYLQSPEFLYELQIAALVAHGRSFPWLCAARALRELRLHAGDRPYLQRLLAALQKYALT